MTISCLARVAIFVEGSLRDHLWENVRILHGVMTNQFFQPQWLVRCNALPEDDAAAADDDADDDDADDDDDGGDDDDDDDDCKRP